VSFTRSTPLANAPDRYDALASAAALFALAFAFLVAHQPVLGVLVTAALVCVYAVARTGDTEHTAVVAAAWILVLASLWVAGDLTGVAVFAVLAVACYSLWRRLRR